MCEYVLRVFAKCKKKYPLFSSCHMWPLKLASWIDYVAYLRSHINGSNIFCRQPTSLLFQTSFETPLFAFGQFICFLINICSAACLGVCWRVVACFKPAFRRNSGWILWKVRATWRRLDSVRLLSCVWALAMFAGRHLGKLYVRLLGNEALSASFHLCDE